MQRAGEPADRNDCLPVTRRKARTRRRLSKLHFDMIASQIINATAKHKSEVSHRPFPDLHVRADASNHRNKNLVGHILLLFRFLRDQYGDVWDDRRIALHLCS